MREATEGFHVFQVQSRFHILDRFLESNLQDGKTGDQGTGYKDVIIVLERNHTGWNRSAGNGTEKRAQGTSFQVNLAGLGNWRDVDGEGEEGVREDLGRCHHREKTGGWQDAWSASVDTLNLGHLRDIMMEMSNADGGL